MEGRVGVGGKHKLGGGDTAYTLLIGEQLRWGQRTTLKDKTSSTPSRYHHTDIHEKITFNQREYSISQVRHPVCGSHIHKGACKYYISVLGVGGGSEGNAYLAYVVRGVGGSRGKMLILLM